MRNNFGEVPRPAAPNPLRSVSALFIAGFWFLQFVALTGERLLIGEVDPLIWLVPRFLTACVGMLLSAGILAVHEHQAGKPLPMRVFTGLALAVAACPVHAAANFGLFEIFLRAENERQASIQQYALAMSVWFWCYFAGSSLLLALVYSRELAARESDFARLERLAQAAQLKALRYQLNPHFMFNTLNSIAALIGTGTNAIAEQMVEGLGEFLRATLAIDPQEDHRLDEEIELQKLYLGIEKLRFPHRISFRLEIAPETAGALVPSLILQPLTENVIKHVVAVSSTNTELVIASRSEAGRLIITVTNSPAERHHSNVGGTGLGLNNVAQRLQARFGKMQELEFGEAADGSFEVRLELPLTFGATHD